MSGPPNITVIGMGNVLLSDEGVGVRVVERLMETRRFPPHVRIVDGGTTAMKGLLPLVEEADHLIVVDALNGHGPAGSIYRYTGADFRKNVPKKISAHEIGFLECLAIAEVNDRSPASVVVIGVKPKDMTTASMSLSPEIEALLDPIGDMVCGELAALGAGPIPPPEGE
ncbi:MAG: HyaD/HybD family hydrogenase maturation endopeptidase [Nitrospinota bacterium]|nr:HyaD/HybD family hydrogenase maturation endopeptidase [Nitrospinota bacterium]MDH5757279.1 HyaD/HybD family hydrogenase maturation endopeptidase [Nitrospinota bacterium]